MDGELHQVIALWRQDLIWANAPARGENGAGWSRGPSNASSPQELSEQAMGPSTNLRELP